MSDSAAQSPEETRDLVAAAQEAADIISDFHDTVGVLRRSSMDLTGYDGGGDEPTPTHSDSGQVLERLRAALVKATGAAR